MSLPEPRADWRESTDNGAIAKVVFYWLPVMPDLSRLQIELTSRFPESWARCHLASFPRAYFATFDLDDVARHLGRIIALNDKQPVTAEIGPEGPGGWQVEVVGYDAFQLLSTICTLLAIHGLAVVEGKVFTSQPPPLDPGRTTVKKRGPRAKPLRPSPLKGPDRRPRIIDVFRVRQLHDAPDWQRFQAELTELTALLRADQYDEVHRRLIGRFADAMSRYRPEQAELETLDLSINPSETESATVVRIGARDHFGFLPLTTSALALCGIRIIQAEIRTRGGRVEDTFWVTDQFGRTIADEPRLRALRLSLILIEHYSSYLHRATDPAAALVHFSRFANDTMARPDWAREYLALDRPEVLDAMVRVLGESDFLWEDYIHAQPENLLPMICEPGEWRRRRSPANLAEERDAALAPMSAVPEKTRVLRRFRDREFFRAGVRAILGLSGGPEGFAAELSDVTEALLQGAYRIAGEALEPVLPRRADGLPPRSVLLALGKCGGRELGFGSDLELMLVYDDRDVTEVVAASGEVVAAFNQFVTLLREVLGDRRGGTFDVDFRLRPHGRAGQPATALSAFGQYYRAGGPAWGYERQSLIKLRAVAGDPELGREVEALRDSFVYGPEPFDLEGCLHLRRLQIEQLVKPGTINAKYSSGALVDVEYLVQALQIAHGWRDRTLRTPNTLQALAALEASGRLSPARVEELRSGYNFLRALIDALRVVHGHAKDLTVPSVGSEEFSMLARRMHWLVDPALLQPELERRLRAVQDLWGTVEQLLGGAD